MFDIGTSRGGFYPATHCLKISAIFGNLQKFFFEVFRDTFSFYLKVRYSNIFQICLVNTGETLTIRTCVVDGGSQRIDTEFARRDPATVVAQNSWQTHGPFDYESNIPDRPKR